MISYGLVFGYFYDYNMFVFLLLGFFGNLMVVLLELDKLFMDGINLNNILYIV